MKKSISFWQMIGFVVTGIGGTLLHFLYDWTGQNPLVGAFAAVNESIWEHMKLLFFPMLVFAVFEYFGVGILYPNFWCGKLLGAVLGLVTIPAVYYTYTGALGVSADWFNIAIFYLVAAMVFWTETKLLQGGKLRQCRLAPLVLLGIGVLFIMLTYNPPSLPLFRG